MHPVTAHQFLFGRDTHQAAVVNLRVTSRVMPKGDNAKSAWQAFFRSRKSQ